MTSSSAHGDVRQGLMIRKMSARYFSFKWKNESGESSSKNCEQLSSDEPTSVLEANAKIGFFKNIKKKISIKNLCKSKRKITTAELPKVVDGSTSDRALSQADEKYVSEVNERMGMPSDETDSSRASNNQSSVDALHRRSDSCSLSNLEVPSNPRLSPSPDCEAGGEDSRGDDPEVGEDVEKGNLSNLSQELLKLSKYGWYWGPISGDEADGKLQAEPDGAFLIRDSSDDRYLLTLSFKSAGKLLHARVEHSGGMFSLCNQGDTGRFSSVPALIDHSMNFSKSAVFCYSRPRYPGSPAFPVRLTKPVSRFTQVRSLQYLCRFVIRQNTRLDNIHKLPLPNTIKGYIEEAHY